LPLDAEFSELVSTPIIKSAGKQHKEEIIPFTEVKRLTRKDKAKRNSKNIDAPT